MKFLEWFDRKNTLAAAAAAAGFSVYIIYMTENNICLFDYKYCLFAALRTMIFIPVFVAATIFYFTSDKVFAIWKKYSLYAIPLSILLISIMPKRHDAFNLFFEQKPMAWICSTLFLIGSMIIFFKKKY